MLNKTLITGIVTEDPQYQHTRTEKAFATVGVAVARPTYSQGTGEPVYDVFRVVLWGTKAEHADINVKSGQTVAVEGRMQAYRYKDPSGVEKDAWELYAERPIEIIASAPDVEGFVTLVAH